MLLSLQRDMQRRRKHDGSALSVKDPDKNESDDEDEEDFIPYWLETSDEEGDVEAGEGDDTITPVQSRGKEALLKAGRKIMILNAGTSVSERHLSGHSVEDGKMKMYRAHTSLARSNNGGRSSRGVSGEGGKHQNRRGSNKEYDVLSAIVHFQNQFRKYEAAKTKAQQDRAATVIQRHSRRLLCQKKLPSRCQHHKAYRLQRAWNLLRGFSINSPESRYRLEAYDGLMNALKKDMTLQDVLSEILSDELLTSMHWDMFSPSKALRLSSARFFCELAHDHLGNQRLLCRLNGLTVGNVRIIAVTSAFETTYREWCEEHQSPVTYEGTVSFIQGVVDTAYHFYESTFHLDKPSSLRRSTFSYPKAYSWQELDPQKHLIGVIMCENIPRALAAFEKGHISELRDIFTEAVKLHDATHDLFDDLVPSAPYYSLLMSLRRRWQAEEMSPLMQRYLELDHTLENLPWCGRNRREGGPALQPETLQTTGTMKNIQDLLSEEALRTAAQSGLTVMWHPVASSYMTFVAEARIEQDREGQELLATLRACFQHITHLKGTNAQPLDLEMQQAKFVRRIDLCKQLHKIEQIPPSLRWEVLGLFAREDFGAAQQLSGYKDAKPPGHRVRSLLSSAEATPGGRAHVYARLGQGECNHDWISWAEVLAHCRKVFYPHEFVSCTSQKKSLGQVRPKVPVNPSQIGATARRVHILQKMMRPSSKGNTGPFAQCMERELLILSKALGAALPILTPAHIGPAPEVPQRVIKRDPVEVGVAREERQRAVHEALISKIRPESARAEPAQRRFPSSPRQQVAKLRRSKVIQSTKQKKLAHGLLREKMQMEWAKEAAERDLKTQKQQRELSALRHASYVELEQKIEFAREQAQKDAVRRAKPGVEAEHIDPEQYRERMSEYDNYVQVRNHLVFAKRRDASVLFPNPSTPGIRGSAISDMAKEVAPTWALSEMRRPRQRKEIHRLDDMRLAQAIKNKKEPHQASEMRVGGYFLKHRDVKEIMDKEYSLEEIRSFCSAFGNSALTDRRIGFLIAAHFYTKEKVETCMGIDLKTLHGDMYEILADLQRDEVPKAVELQQLQLQKSKQEKNSANPVEPVRPKGGRRLNTMKVSPRAERR